MTDRQRTDLQTILSQMSEEEKQALAQELLRGLARADESEKEASETNKRQLAAWEQLWAEQADQPPEPEPDDGLSGSRDHDEILYGRGRKCGPPPEAT